MNQSIRNIVLLAGIVFILPLKSVSQNPVFTRQDTLRGSITPERSWWDLTYYHLDIVVNPADSTIHGTNTVTYRVLNPYNRMQIDLQEPMKLTDAHLNNRISELHKRGKCILDRNCRQTGDRVRYILLF